MSWNDQLPDEVLKSYGERSRSVHLSRKDGEGRAPMDFYPTDRRTVENILRLVDKRFYQHRRVWEERGINERYPKRILDVGAGAGIWGEVAREIWKGAEIWGVEVREVPKPEAYDYWLREDVLVPDEFAYYGEFARFDLVMGNPPYNIAEECVAKGVPWLTERGQLVFLLRLAFLEGVGRRDGLYKTYPLTAAAVCSKRPSFQADGRTNATAFAAFLWENPKSVHRSLPDPPAIHFL